MTLFNQNLLYKKTTMTMAGQQTFIENTFLPTIPMIYPTTYQALLTSPSTTDLALNADKEITILLSPKEIQNIFPPIPPLPKLEFDTQLNPFWNLYTNINQRLKVQTPPPSSLFSRSWAGVLEARGLGTEVDQQVREEGLKMPHLLKLEKKHLKQEVIIKRKLL